MPLGDDLTHVSLAQVEGVLYGVGIAGGYLWCEYSNDHGATKAAFQNGDTRRAIAPTQTARARVALETYSTSELQVAVDGFETVLLYSSRDGGESWVASSL